MNTANASRVVFFLSMLLPVHKGSGAKRHSLTPCPVRPGARVPSERWMGERVVEGQRLEVQSGFASNSPSKPASGPLVPYASPEGEQGGLLGTFWRF